ncbi:MAG: response regulator, partial [Sneathiella sp.]
MANPDLEVPTPEPVERRPKHDIKIRNAKILVVDDSDLIRELIGACLMTDGYYNISYAENGQDALEVIELETPDLIILDLEMPVMDGFELCKELRARQKTASIPILIQSGRDTADDITRAFDYGASDMVVKPIKKFEILARTKVHLEHHFFVEKLTDFHNRVASELEQARKLQLDICPNEEELESFRTLYGLAVGWYYEPSSELGGDIGGIYPIDENHVAFFIADFSGHGVAAALNTFRM